MNELKCLRAYLRKRLKEGEILYWSEDGRVIIHNKSTYQNVEYCMYRGCALNLTTGYAEELPDQQ